MGGIWEEYWDVGGRALTGNGVSELLGIKIMRADSIGPLRDRCGGYPRELSDE